MPNQHPPTDQPQVLMDILRALGSPNVDICRKTLEVAMDLVSTMLLQSWVSLLHAWS